MAKFYYGGQAVMEGVMMRGRTTAAMAVRKPDESIFLYEETLNPRLYQSRLFRLPFLRGMLLLWETLILGTRLMGIATNVAIGDTNETSDTSDTTDTTDTSDTSDSDEPDAETADTREQGRIQPTISALPEGDDAPSFTSTRLDEEPPAAPAVGGIPFALTLVVSLGFAVVIFFLLPLLITGLLHNQVGSGWLSLIIEGIIRLALLVGYLYLIGRVPDIQRLFGYHGAEHKTINAMEQGNPLDIEHVRRASRVHTRCGTGFLLIVMVVSIFVFAFVGSPALPIKILSRIVLVPIVAGIAYELMRLGAANYRFRVVRWLLAPGLALQGLTTREPDDSMIECAIVALQRVMLRDKLRDIHEKQPKGINIE